MREVLTLQAGPSQPDEAPLVELISEKSHYDRMAEEERDEARVRHMRDVETLRKNVEYVRNFLSGHRRGQLLLDVGCGNGQFTVGVSDLFDQVVAVDISSKMIKRCSNRPANVDFVQATATELPLRSSIFPTMISLAMVHNFGQANLEHSLREVCRVAAPNSFVFITFSRLRPGHDAAVREALRKASYKVRQSLPSRLGLVKFSRIWATRG